ncbi:lipid A biosynthesis lauroyl acyltransferase, putative [Roseobacter sp. SK209-2-6]|uniref:lysophospholipid acyltransferase family protein n=1 Tax=Roseobacter sp. SK209-2-6 TaxID=388739 RepID=UPI0000F3E80A|nr:lysophospholipid acyltransferase family protein [Roseobacter sp. SK209-2-6]EBA16329.1 lipid A biosynthesis lauroyl acyltransferase, putative [Roseobacter sp. SK209-2-6]
MPQAPSALSLKQRISYFTGNLALRGVIGLVGLLPYGWRVPALGKLTSLLGPIAGMDKRVRANLALTCPELTEAEVAHLCREVSNNAGRVIAELYAGKPFLERATAAPISGPGFEALQKARDENRPVILVTGHFGNYDAARSGLIARGFSMGSLYRRMANPYFNEHYVRTIEGIGKPMFEQGKRGMMEMVRHLKQKGIIAIVADLHVHGGELVEFFGKPAVTSTVPAELALKYNAALIPIYGIRRENGLDFDILLNPEIEHSDALTMTKAICDDLEGVVRKNMGQWFWIHRRWKPYVPAPKSDTTSGPVEP